AVEGNTHTAPASSDIPNSNTEASKLGEDNANTRSPGPTRSLASRPVACGLNLKEGPPPIVCSGCRAESGGGQDPPDRASAYAVAEPGEFSVDSAMAPGGVLLGQVQHQSPNLIINRWAA
ncbi:MAG: hypothetical protein LC749_06555, partial [Actinobacteria bacterium]|nr:hypothetical protein [Actinomycetota bacterium]